MKNELDRKLCEAYPEIFADRFGDMRTTAMCWGLECGDGWYNILNHLCHNIQSHIDWSQESNEFDLKYNKEHPDNPRTVRATVPQVVAIQVKEKFGTLRFYYSGGDDIVDGMVRMAESMSAVMCEQCGAPAETQGDGWVHTLCSVHEKEYQEKFK